MKELASNSLAGRVDQHSLTCPSCEKSFDMSNVGGLYGLHPTHFDDVFVTVLCTNCVDVIKVDLNDPRRQALKKDLEAYFRNPAAHRFNDSIALTSLKILEIHRGNLVKALELGWPFPKAMHHYHVLALDGGMVIVSEKEADHDA